VTQAAETTNVTTQNRRSGEPAVAAFTRLVDCLDRSDFDGARKALAELRALGWSVVPIERRGRGGRT
jgi:hypothetical protein